MRAEAGPQSPLTVLLLGDDVLAREGLASRLTQTGEVELLGQERPRHLWSARPGPPADVVVLDLGAQDTEDLAVLKPRPSRPVVALVADPQSGAEAAHAGARGVVYRDASAAALLAVVRVVAQGFAVLQADVLDELLPPRPPADGTTEELTPREKEVMTLLVDGLSNKGLGARLGISEHTAKFHVTSIMQKLGATRRTEVVAKAARLGWIRL